jgi:chromosome segregation ATPase
MTSRPKSSRRFPPTSIPDSPTDFYPSQMKSAKLSREVLTPEDVMNLKREKQNLLHERTILKAKIARYASYHHHHSQPANKTDSILHSLEQEVRQLEQQTAAKRAEVAQLMASDEAAIVSELKEESKMLHLEMMRIRRERQAVERELQDVSAQLEAACQKYSPAEFEKQQKLIKKLEREMVDLRTKNAAAKELVARMKEDEEYRMEEEQEAKEKVADLKAKIRREQQQIAEINQEMTQMRAEHLEVVERLRLQL